MSNEAQEHADALFEAALEGAGTRDPREFYRERLRELRASNPSAYDEAVEYYSQELIPSIAEERVDPLAAWQAYGCKLAALTAPGHVVEVDETGRSHPHDAHAFSTRLVLHLPEGKGGRAMVVGLPSEPSPAQMATFDLLVSGKQRLRERNA